MFQKKDIIFNENLGVCRVEDIVKLSPNKSNIYNYYVLCPVNNKEKKAYIPVENHTAVLRELITVQEAKDIIKDGMENISKPLKDEIKYVLENSEE